MSTLTIVPPTTFPVPRATPGTIVDVPAQTRPGDVPRRAVIVQLSEQVRELTDTEKQETDERRQRLRSSRLPQEQQRELRELKRIDREVRNHEAAHKAAAGAYARGAAQFTAVVGPDGKRYAIGGEVAIDTSPVKGNPEATVQKMEQIARAALAPADPSAQDHAVAAQARQAAGEARREILREKEEQARTTEAERTGSESPIVPPATSPHLEAGRNDDTTSGRVAPGSAPAIREEDLGATAHGHATGASCPICTAQTAPPARLYGLVDRSA